MTTTTPGRGRGPLASLLAAATGLSLLATILALYAEAVLFDRDEFTDRAVTAIHDPAVQPIVVERLADEVERQVPELAGARGLLDLGVNAVVESPVFDPLAAAAVRETHTVVFDGVEESNVQVVIGVGEALRTTAERASPEVAALVPEDLDARLLEVQDAAVLTRTADLAEDARRLAALLPFVTAGLAVTTVVVARDRRRVVTRLGVVTAVVGLMLALALAGGRALLVASVPDGGLGDAAGVLWDTFLNDLFRVGLVTAAVGGATAAVAVVTGR